MGSQHCKKEKVGGGSNGQVHSEVVSWGGGVGSGGVAI